MKKRLRKKRHKGEFQEFGFEVWVKLKDNLNTNTGDQFIDDFIIQAIEANQLMFGGGGRENLWEGFVTLNRRGSATQVHQDQLQSWLSSRPEVSEFQIGDLQDAWYG